MATPALRIPIRADLETFKRQMNETTSLAKKASESIARQFILDNKDAFNPLIAGALKFTGQIALVVGSVKLISAAISGAREQMAEMVAIADKAKKQLRITSSVAAAENRNFPSWIDMNTKELKGIYKSKPERIDLPATINESLIVELYSK